MNEAAWTPEQARLIGPYGTCERCGAPRDIGMAVRSDGSLHTEMRCTASPCQVPPPPSIAELIAWAKTAGWKFTSYYKYDFTFAAQGHGFAATATAGGQSERIYRFTVEVDQPLTWDEICGAGTPYLTFTDHDGNLIWQGREPSC